jgi:hypothetical protein
MHYIYQIIKSPPVVNVCGSTLQERYPRGVTRAQVSATMNSLWIVIYKIVSMTEYGVVVRQPENRRYHK